MKYCKHLFKTLYFQKDSENFAKLSVCCVAKMSEPKSLINFDDDFLKTQRTIFLDTGKLPPACEVCDSLEDKTGQSFRTSNEENTKPFDTIPELELLQYNCDNICNLKCIVCSSYFSSSWIEDEKKLGIERKEPIIKMKPTKHNKLALDLDFSKLKTVYFNGGEPLMSKDHINLMQHLKSNFDPSKISLSYSTNGTFFVSDEVINLWKLFKDVNLMFSLDATGSAFEYIRYPAIWSEVENNVKKFHDLKMLNLILRVQANVGMHNILYLDDIFSWVAQNNYEYNAPTLTIGGLSIFNFPYEHKEKLLTHVEKYSNFDGKQYILDSIKNINPNSQYDWKEYFELLDSIRSVNWKTNLSRLDEFLK